MKIPTIEKISVKDALPECCVQHGDIFASVNVITWDSSNKKQIDQYFKKGEHTNKGWTQESEGWVSGNEVTHWAVK